MSLPFHFVADLQALVADLPEDSIISRTFYESERYKAILFGFAAGQELSEHTASQPAILHFVSGEAQVKLGEESFEAAANTWAHMDARLPHSVYARTPVLMLLVLFK